MRERFIRIFLFCAVLALISAIACSYKPPSNANARPGGGLNFFPMWMDSMLGAQYGTMYARQLPLLHDRVVEEEVQHVGDHLVKTYYGSERPPYPFQFHVVNMDIVNAFALPGGQVFVFRGLLDRVHNEGELAGVMAHEMGHAVARHGTKSMSRSLLYSSALQVGSGILSTRHRGLGTLAYVGGNVGLSLHMLKNTRDHEREADWIGVHTVSRAGYNPTNMVTMFNTLEKESKDKAPRSALFLSTHPGLDERRKNIQKEIAKLPAQEYKDDQFEFGKMKTALHSLPPAPKEWGGRRVLSLTSLDAFGQMVAEANAEELQQEYQTNGTQTVDVFVPANRGWIDTGIVLMPGQRVEMKAQGTVKLDRNDEAGPKEGLTGALRLASGQTIPFEVGSHQSFNIMAPSRLYFGIRDSQLSDNAGWFQITTRIINPVHEE